MRVSWMLFCNFQTCPGLSAIVMLLQHFLRKDRMHSLHSLWPNIEQLAMQEPPTHSDEIRLWHALSESPGFFGKLLLTVLMRQMTKAAIWQRTNTTLDNVNTRSRTQPRMADAASTFTVLLICPMQDLPAGFLGVHIFTGCTVARRSHVGEVLGSGSAGSQGPRKAPRSRQGWLHILFIEKLKESEALTNLHLLALVEKESRRPHA